jgi:hypothetical protein
MDEVLRTLRPWLTIQATQQEEPDELQDWLRDEAEDFGDGEDAEI